MCISWLFFLKNRVKVHGDDIIKLFCVVRMFIHANSYVCEQNTANNILHKLAHLYTTRDMELYEHSNTNLTVLIHGDSNC